jgi:O-methyltransferase involved in polyketide biosynthesis
VDAFHPTRRQADDDGGTQAAAQELARREVPTSPSGAKKPDQVASAFLARHPDAVGLDLGTGLDTRVVRLAPPSTVDRYDVDFPRSPPPASA